MEIDLNLAELKLVLESKSDQTTRNIASKLGRSQKDIHYQFKQLGLVPKLGQSVPHDDLTSENKKNVSTAISEPPS